MTPDTAPLPAWWGIWIRDANLSAGANASGEVEAESRFAEAARLILRDCESRGVHPRSIVSPDAAEIASIVASQQPVVVVSSAPFPGQLSADGWIVAEDGPGSSSTGLHLTPGSSAPEIALQILTELERSGAIPIASDSVYSEEEEERLRKALDDLGYL